MLRAYRVRFQLLAQSSERWCGQFSGARGKRDSSSATHARIRLRNAVSLSFRCKGVVSSTPWRSSSAKPMRQLFQRAANDPHIVGVLQVRRQSSLCRLILHVTTELCATQAPAQILFGKAGEVFGDVIRAFDHGDDLARVVERHGTPEQAVAVAIQIIEHDRFRQGAKRLCSIRPVLGDPPTHVFVVSLRVGLDLLQASGGRGGDAASGQ